MDYYPLSNERERKTLTEIRNPDTFPSKSALFFDSRGNDVVMVMQVAGLGVLVFRAATSWLMKDGKLEFKGVSEFTNADIRSGLCPE